MERHFKQLTYADRIKMETLLNKGESQASVARYLGVNRSTICREKKRGAFTKTNSDLTEETSYSCDLGQKAHDWKAQGKGANLKIGKDKKLADYLEDKVVNEKYSPEAALAEAKKNSEEFETMICIGTFYNYIDKELFLHLTNKDLPVKGQRKKHKKKVRAQKKASVGTSIEKRPKEVKSRDVFGHWEMDTVKGKRGTTKSCMLVLTERKTRKELIFKLNDQKAASVVEVLDRLEKKWGERFSKVFKSITVDNGVEFSDFEGMERSILNEGEKRIFIFYCHPYSSWERGSNENQNRLIRRHVPKGEDFDTKQDSDIEYIEKWINNYPRRMFDYKTSKELFDEELSKIS